MLDPGFRSATAADASELTWLEQISREHLAARRGGDLWLADHPAQSPGWPAVDRGNVIVSTIDDVVVGYTRVDVRGRVLYVEEIFVHPEAREVGCGDGLLAAAIDVGRSAGAARVEASALPGDRETKNLYERAGITAKRIIVSAPIRPDA